MAEGKMAEGKMADGKKTSGPKRGPSPARQAAVAAYKAAHGSEPPARMTIKAMKTAVGQEGLQQRHADAKALSAKAAYETQWSSAGPAKASAEYKARFGYAPPPEMSEPAVKRWTAGPLQVAPGRPGDPAYEAKVATLTGRTPAPTTAPAPAAPHPVTNDSHYGLTTGAEGASMAARAGAVYNTANHVLPAIAAGAQFGKAYWDAKERGASTGDATIEGAKAAAVPAALAAAPVVEMVAGGAATGAFAVAGAAVKGIGLADAVFLNMAFAKTAFVVGAAGVALKGVELAAKVGGRVALPAAVAYGAYTGARNDGLRGAVRGALTSVDPTEFATLAGAKSGLVGTIYDAMAGTKSNGQASAGPMRLNAGQSREFAAADQSYGAGRSAAPASDPHYKDTWTDSRGRSYTRKDMSVRKDAT